jgi:serine protease Do
MMVVGTDIVHPRADKQRAPSLGPTVRLGVNMVAVNKPIADFLHMPAPQGMFVAKVTPGSVAEAAGIKPGDILMRFGETELMSQCDLFAALAARPSGITIPITALRENSSWVANVNLQADATTQTAQAPPPGAPADAARPTVIYTELTKLDERRRKGILTEAEFQAQKQKILISK